MAEPPDFEQIAHEIITGRFLIDAHLVDESMLAEHRERIAQIADKLRDVWNARGAADQNVFRGNEAAGRTPICETFTEDAGEPSACRHCGWTHESHAVAAAIKEQDR